MTDRIPGAPGRCKAVVTGEDLRKLQAGEEFAITLRRDDQPIKEGTPYSKASVLPDALASRLCPGVDDPAPKDAFAALYEQKADTVRRAAGRTIILRDAAPTPLMGLKLYGKTTQNGTPTPDAPVALEHAGKDGSMTVKVIGKNLFNKDTIEIGYIEYDLDGIVVPNENYRASDWIPVSGNYITITTPQAEGMWGAFYDENKRFISGYNGYGSGYPGYKPTKEIPTNAKYTRLTTHEELLDVVQVELGSVATAYEPYKEQIFTVVTPNGLPGIGEYRDEIDFANGTYTKRIKTVVLDGSENNEWSYNSSANAPFFFRVSDIADCTGRDVQLLCDKYPPIGINETWRNYDYLVSRFAPSDKHLCFRDINFSTLDEWKAYLAANPITVQYVLAEPIITALTTEQLEAYAKLHTYSPTTTITNDAGAEMALTYYTPTTAVQMLHSPKDKGKLLSIDEHGCVVLAPNEIGSVKETFAVVVDKEPIEDDYMGGTGYHIGIYSYGLNSNLFGKTLRIKTYAYGQMRCLVNGIDVSTLDHELEDRVINPDADITKDPQSGVCEFDVYVPAGSFGEINILVPFVNNPYTEFEIHEKKGTAWDEIKSLSDKGVIASGGGVEGYWRKWNDGTAECWLPVNDEFIYNTDTMISVTCTLPFEFVETYAVFTDITGEKTQENYDPTHVAAAAFLDYVITGGLLELLIASPYSDWDCVYGYVYMLGRWKYV